MAGRLGAWGDAMNIGQCVMLNSRFDPEIAASVRWDSLRWWLEHDPKAMRQYATLTAEISRHKSASRKTIIGRTLDAITSEPAATEDIAARIGVGLRSTREALKTLVGRAMVVRTGRQGSYQYRRAT